ncbi:MAG: FHA domain-containing protein [Lachnospiraceae bacterium]|nr:FHA domain-containing protein [Lachnospiraceae bacterium]
MYRIAILEKDTAYLERLIFFLKEHHGESFEINAVDSLDDLDMEIMQCSALFFGDNVEVDDALFPVDIGIGYLTENDETDGQHINKYQSMEQIYKRMMKLCEERKTSDTVADDKPGRKEAKYNAETVTVDGETYRIYHIAEDQIDRLAIRMLNGNRIKGLPQTEYRDGRLKIRITGMESLYEYIRENNTIKGKERMLTFFSDMISTALSLEEYMLSLDRLMLDPREIYISETRDNILIPYIPIQCSETKDVGQCLAEIRELCSELIEGAGVRVNEEIVKEAQDVYGRTEEFENLQKNARDSLKLKESTKTLGKEAIPYIVRKRTGEKVVINRSLFKLGKDASYVDYCIKDNPAVSRNHADIVRKPDGYYLIDKGSLNHTFVNGKKLAADEYRKLEDGCLMQLADEVFEFGLK